MSYRDNRTVTIKTAAAQGGGNQQRGSLPSKATEYRIDEDHANPLAAWEAMGSPDEPSAAQLEALVAASVVAPAALEVAVDGSVAVAMGPNSAVVVVFG